MSCGTSIRYNQDEDADESCVCWAVGMFKEDVEIGGGEGTL